METQTNLLAHLYYSTVLLIDVYVDIMLTAEIGQ